MAKWVESICTCISCYMTITWNFRRKVLMWNVPAWHLVVALAPSVQWVSSLQRCGYSILVNIHSSVQLWFEFLIENKCMDMRSFINGFVEMLSLWPPEPMLLISIHLFYPKLKSQLNIWFFVWHSHWWKHMLDCSPISHVIVCKI